MIEMKGGVLVVHRLRQVLQQECLIVIGARCENSGVPSVIRSQLGDEEVDLVFELGARTSPKEPDSWCNKPT